MQKKLTKCKILSVVLPCMHELVKFTFGNKFINKGFSVVLIFYSPSCSNTVIVYILLVFAHMKQENGRNSQ